MFLKRIVTGVLCMVTTSIVLSPCYGKSQNDNIDEVAIKATNCSSVTIQKSDTDELKFDYDKNYFHISTDESEANELKINIEQTKSSFLTRATIYLPDKDYNNIYAELDTSGMTFKDIDCNLNVDAKMNSAVGFKVPESFSSNITLNGEQGTYSVTFLDSLPQNLKFVLDANQCPVSLPDEWEYEVHSPHFEYSQGDGSALIKLNIDFSPLSVKIK